MSHSPCQMGQHSMQMMYPPLPAQIQGYFPALDAESLLHLCPRRIEIHLGVGIMSSMKSRRDTTPKTPGYATWNSPYTPEAFACEGDRRLDQGLEEGMGSSSLEASRTQLEDHGIIEVGKDFQDL